MLPASSRGPRGSTSIADAAAVEGAGCRAAGRRGILVASARRSGVYSALVTVEAVIARGRSIFAVVLHGSLVVQELRGGENANHRLMNPLSASWGDLGVPEEDARGLGSVGKVTHSVI
eukprot:1974617-Amphidinium_carterae.2